MKKAHVAVDAVHIWTELGRTGGFLAIVSWRKDGLAGGFDVTVRWHIARYATIASTS